MFEEPKYTMNYDYLKENGEDLFNLKTEDYKICDLLNAQDKQIKELEEENQQLKEALLFFVDVANCECSSNWDEDMEKDCQKLFNCSYKEAEEKYGNFDSSWWELE